MTDYFNSDDKGCCLNCEDSEPGCLCFDCKCKKCDHYNWMHGVCDLAQEFKWRSQHPICRLCGMQLEWININKKYVLVSSGEDISHSEVCRGNSDDAIQKQICMKCSNRIIKIDNDELADFKCPKCGSYFKHSKH